MRRAKLPNRPPGDLASRSPDWYHEPTDLPLWTIAAGSGRFARPFGEMRTYGPRRTARFDPHPEPPGAASGELVLYAARDLPTVIAERYQRRRAVDLSEAARPVVYSWFATRALRLLDLTGPGALRLGASHAINTGPRAVCRSWARALRSAWPEADGLRYSSSMTGRECLALWAPAIDSFPPAPSFALPMDLSSREWQALIQGACAELGYDYWA